VIDRQELIKAIGDRAEQYIVNALGVVNYNERTHKGLCPFHSEKSPSFSYDTKTHTFKCFGCGETVDVVSYLIDHEGLSYIEAIKQLCDEEGIDAQIDDVSIAHKKREDEQVYVKPNVKATELTDAMVNHIKSRGISERTIKNFRVVASTQNFKDGNKKAFAFPCYDENNDLVNYSFRTKDKMFKQVKDAKSILWGMWLVQDFKQLVITEGQFDTMAVYESGVKNVVSIPAGSNNRKYIDNCFEFLSKFDELIFWIDNDEPGRHAGQNLKDRFPNARILAHNECKDPNEVLIKLGKEEVKRFLNQKPPLPKGFKDISDANYDLKEPEETERIETGFADYDRHINDWKMKQLTVVFGRDNEGKSTFISQIVAHQLHRRVKTFLFSAELGEQSIQDWLYRQLVGSCKNCYTKESGKYEAYYALKSEVLKAVRDYTKDNLFIIDESQEEIINSNEILFQRMGILASKFGVRLFLLDNLQAILTSKFSDINRDQSYFMERCRQFAKKYNVHVVVVAHPHKVEELTADENTTVGNLKKDSISGSKDISNKAHNIISIERDFTGVFFDMILTNLKDKHRGVRKGFKYNFNTRTQRFYNDDVPNEVSKDFSVYLPKNLRINDGRELKQKYQEVNK